MKHDDLEKLKASRFRRNWHLDDLDRKKIVAYGLNEIEKHAEAIVEQKLRVKLESDGEQTPYKGHPVFKAMHATATCCRGCLFSWHRIPPYKILEDKEVRFVVNLMMRWIKKELAAQDGTLMPYLAGISKDLSNYDSDEFG